MREKGGGRGAKFYSIERGKEEEGVEHRRKGKDRGGKNYFVLCRNERKRGMPLRRQSKRKREKMGAVKRKEGCNDIS